MRLWLHAPYAFVLGLVASGFFLLGASRGEVPPDVSFEQVAAYVGSVLISAAVAWGAVRTDVKWLIQEHRDLKDDQKNLRKRLDDETAKLHHRINEVHKDGGH